MLIYNLDEYYGSLFYNLIWIPFLCQKVWWNNLQYLSIRWNNLRYLSIEDRLAIAWSWSYRQDVRNRIHCKKRLAVFPSPAGMSLTLPGAEKFNYSPPGRVWLVTSRLGMGKLLTFFTVYLSYGNPAEAFWNVYKIHFTDLTLNEF